VSAGPGLPIVLWDLDGTLVELAIPRAAVDTWRARLGEMFAPFGYAGPWAPLLPSLEAALATAGRAAAAGARGAPAAPAVYAALDLWESEALGGVTVLEGAAEGFARLAARGVRQAVITNNGPTVAARALEVLAEWARARGGVWPAKIDLVTRGPGLRAKPAPDMLARACDLAGAEVLPASGVVVIGDRDDDARAAAALEERRARPVLFVRARAGRFGAAAPDERGAEPSAAALLALGVEPAWLWPERAGSTPREAP